MKAGIITIGDELLIGQVVDTNSSWLGQELGQLGIAVVHRCATGDLREDIRGALDHVRTLADVILITGGLGPTKDDITREVLCEYFGSQLVMNARVLEQIESLLEKRGVKLTETNRRQALVPDNCEVLFNRSGTAPGMLFRSEGKIFASMPGVPYEMKTMFTEQVVPLIRSAFTLPAIIHRTVQTSGIGESFLADRIASWEDALPAHLRLAYLPSVGAVRLRLSGHGSDAQSLHEEMDAQVEQLYALAGDYIYGEGDDTLHQVTGILLRDRGETVSTAESCTGGYIAHLITSVAGSSAYYMGSVVAYDNRIKTAELGVDEDVLKNHGAVSEACVRQMAENIRARFGTTYGIATSGIAGPGGGTPEKPVGTVWIAVSDGSETRASVYQMGDDRSRTIQRTGLQALDLLRRMILARS